MILMSISLEKAMGSQSTYGHVFPTASDFDGDTLPIWDRAAALERADGDEELVQEIVGLFREDSPRLIQEIEHAVANQDADRLYRAAHTLKGSAGSIGAAALARAAQILETIGRGHHLNEASPAWGRLQDELQRLHHVLDSNQAVPVTP